LQKQLIATAEDFDREAAKLVRRFAYVRRKNIAHFAMRFAEHFGLGEIPRNPQRILPEVFGISLDRAMLARSTPAEWIRFNDHYTIRFSAHREGEQIALTLWHELAEILFANERFPTRLTSDQECDLATLFAVHLMMPENDVRELAAELGHSAESDKTANLAARFGVSMTAMRCRLGELGLVVGRAGAKQRWIKVPVKRE
jgi:predicted transcriptional regulator